MDAQVNEGKGQPPLGEAPAGVSEGKFRQILDALRKNYVRPTRVAVMGQTGVGKSTLINALFGSDLRTGDVRPTTTEPADVTQELADGRSLTFVDLPGMGESRTADDRYLAMYRSELQRADILLWLFSCESRSTLTDLNAIAALAGDQHARDLLRGKVTFALTKADLVAHPWVLSHDGHRASFTPHPDSGALLESKARYIADSIEASLYFRPDSVPVTSTMFRVGLPELLSVVLQKTDDATAWRTQSLFNLDSLNRLAVGEALTRRNFIIWNERTRELRDVALTKEGTT